MFENFNYRVACLSFLVFLALVSCEVFKEPLVTEPKPDPSELNTVALILGTNAAESYEQGEEASIKLDLKIDDSKSIVDNAVLFLTLVERDLENKSFPSAVQLILEDANITNDIFSKPIQGSKLREGLSTRLKFLFKSGAKEGSYALNIQLFNGTNTNPATVKIEDRIDMRVVIFEILAKND